MNLNKVILVGRVTKTPESTTTQSGTPVTKVSLATNEVFTDKQGVKQEKTTFHNLVLWSKLAEIASKYIVTGHEILVEGKIDNRSYEDKQGAKRYISEIIVSSLQLGSKPKGLETNQQDNRQSQSSGLPVIDQDEELDVKNIPF